MFTIPKAPSWVDAVDRIGTGGGGTCMGQVRTSSDWPKRDFRSGLCALPIASRYPLRSKDLERGRVPLSSPGDRQAQVDRCTAALNERACQALIYGRLSEHNRPAAPGGFEGDHLPGSPLTWRRLCAQHISLAEAQGHLGDLIKKFLCLCPIWDVTFSPSCCPALIKGGKPVPGGRHKTEEVLAHAQEGRGARRIHP